ncbi:MAG: dethiobiotin synthase [Sediminibacterium sp.]
MNQPIFITGIGTEVGKTFVSAFIAEALEADYWKPVQAGVESGTDKEKVANLISNNITRIHPELYKFKATASPHTAASREGVEIELLKLFQASQDIQSNHPGKILVIEGNEGLLTPLQEKLFVADFIKLLDAKVILVNREYPGSINHSLLTAAFCRSNQMDVLGWFFTELPLSTSNRWYNGAVIKPSLPFLHFHQSIKQLWPGLHRESGRP